MFWVLLGVAMLLGIVVRASLPKPPAPTPVTPPRPTKAKPKPRL